MKQLLLLCVIAFLCAGCAKDEPDLTGNFAGEYVHSYQYPHQDIQEETRWRIARSGENRLELRYTIEPKYTGTKPGTVTLSAPIEVLLEDIAVSDARQFSVDQVKEIVYGKIKASTHIRIKAVRQGADLKADMLFVDVASGNADSQQFVLTKR